MASTSRKHIYKTSEEEEYQEYESVYSAYGTRSAVSKIFYVSILLLNMILLGMASTFGTLSYLCNPEPDLGSRMAEMFGRQITIQVNLNASDAHVAPSVHIEANTTEYYQWPEDIIPEDAFVTRFECGVQSSKPNTSIHLQNASVAIPHSWPWTVEVGTISDEELLPTCIGSLVSPRHVVTAKSCFGVNWKFKKYEVVLEKHAQTGGIRNEVCVVRHHPVNDYDIVLLTLRNEVEPSFKTSIICLPKLNMPPLWGHRCWTAGWNENIGDPSMKYLKQSAGLVVAYELCDLESWLIHDLKHICTTFEAGTCPGGLGSPLMCLDEDSKWVLHGVTSWKDYCQEGRMSAYYKVATVMSWLCCYMQTMSGCTGVPCLINGQHVNFI